MLFFKRVRGITIGSTVLLGPLETPRVLEHELVHVEQFLRAPLIFPVLYWKELILHGYVRNKYEVEAYTRAGNQYGDGVMQGVKSEIGKQEERNEE
jgi:hypothetical protein